jgi:hypothetical protein
MPMVQIRLPQDILEDLNALVDRMQEHEDYRAWRLTVTDVIRIALGRGVESLKRDFPPQQEP